MNIGNVITIQVITDKVITQKDKEVITPIITEKPEDEVYTRPSYNYEHCKKHKGNKGSCGCK